VIRVQGRARRTLVAVEQSVAAADSKLATDQVNLFLALGGGWEDPAVSRK
jgi:outer membrane protein, multidrug efflux system